MWSPKTTRGVRGGWLAIPALACVLMISGCSVLRAFFPSSDHDEVAPELPADLAHPAVLVFSKTNGFRHEEAIAAGLPVFAEMASRRGWSLFATEKGAIHSPEQLARFDAIVWFQVSGDVLDDAQRESLQDWIGDGGGFFGIHGTGGDTSYEWSWHPETLVGAQFIGHPMGPQFQEATIRVEAPEHPALAHLEREWVRTEEWYSFAKSPRETGARILATLDESTYAPDFKLFFIDRDLRMGADHPIIWSQCIGRGRSLYSALGHQAEAYSEPEHLELLEEGVAWLLDDASNDCGSGSAH